MAGRVFDKTGDHPMKNTMTYCGYMASLEFDPDDNILVGRVK